MKLINIRTFDEENQIVEPKKSNLIVDWLVFERKWNWLTKKSKCLNQKYRIEQVIICEEKLNVWIKSKRTTLMNTGGKRQIAELNNDELNR